MTSLEEGEEAREDSEGMTTFEPYVAGRIGVSYSREVNEHGRQQQQQQQKSRGNRTGEPELTGIGAAKVFFKRIRSSLSTAASLPQPPPRSSASAGASKRSGQQARKQPRPINQPPTTITRGTSAPVLHKPPAGTHKKPPSAPRDTPTPPKSGQSTPRHTSPSSPKVFDDMASYGPGSGRSRRPPPSDREKGPFEPRSKSEEPFPSTQKVELQTPRALDDNAQITLMSYSDVQKQRAAKSAAAGGYSKSATLPTSPPRPGTKQQLNKQDVLKRIGSIENDEVS